MLAAPIPATEALRLASLEQLQILYTPPEETFDRVTRRLADIFEAPLATMTLMDSDQQYYKSAIGLPEALLASRVLPRELAMCAHTVANNEMLVVDDIAQDDRFHDNPILLAGGARFYAGAPLRSEDGHAVGSLCIGDTKPRTLSSRERELLQLVADGLMSEMRMRAASRQLDQLSRQVAQRNHALERDLAHARAVQQFLLPPAAVCGQRFTVSHFYRPFDHIGGDFLDARLRPDGSAAIILADVSGHGASAALASAMIKTTFLRAADDARSPADILNAIHREMCACFPSGMFITAIAAIFNPAASEALIASAGHPHPILLSAAGALPIPTDNELPLLIDPDTTYTNHVRVPLAPGDRLLAFTDGAIEATSPDGLELGAEGLARFAVSLMQPDTFLPDLFDAIHGYANQHIADDVALLTLEAHP